MPGISGNKEADMFEGFLVMTGLLLLPLLGLGLFIAYRFLVLVLGFLFSKEFFQALVFVLVVIGSFLLLLFGTNALT
jgi:hypothetical protein